MVVVIINFDEITYTVSNEDKKPEVVLEVTG